MIIYDADHFMRKYIFAAFFTAISLLGSRSAYAGPGVQCQVADPQDSTLNVRASPNGMVINRLQNGRIVRIDETKDLGKGKVWVSVSGSYKGDYRTWGWVIRNRLKCINTASIPRIHLSAEAIREAGIALQQELDKPELSVSCSIVPNGWGVSLSRELYRKYQKRGFSEEAVCLALGGDGVYFDPATGRQLKLYDVAGDLTGARPIWLPDCFRSVQIIKQGGYLVSWRPNGCKLRFDPTSGLPINNAELVDLSSGGEAGGGVDEDNHSNGVSSSRLRQLVAEGR